MHGIRLGVFVRLTVIEENKVMAAAGEQLGLVFIAGIASNGNCSLLDTHPVWYIIVIDA